MDGTIRIGKKNVVIGISFLLFVLVAFGGWYAYKFRSCIGNVSYVPPQNEEKIIRVLGDSGVTRKVVDEGDYHLFEGEKFQTVKDAIRVCMWN